MITLPENDVAILRELAKQVAELAARPIEQEKRDLWYRHNALERTRPLIFCDPENGWNEIITQDSLTCQDPTARGWEFGLRREIFWGTRMCDDRVIEPYFTVGLAYSETDWGMHHSIIGTGGAHAYAWDAPLKNLADVDKLRFPTITLNPEATEQWRSLAEDVFGGILTVRVKPGWWWSLGMTWPLVNLRGLEQVMWDMIDDPEGLHRLMSIIRDGTLAKIDFVEQNGLLALNNGGDYVGSGGFGWSKELPSEGFDGTHVRTRDMWGFCESQETVLVSPGMFEEFVFQYQLPILERFGLNCYGCCEPLNTRWHVVKKAPRLRRISVSAWADLEFMGRELGDKYIYSMKPNPSHLAMSTLDEDLIRTYTRKILDAAKGGILEIVMKDNHTIGNDPTRVTRWVQLVREEIAEHWV